MENQDAVKLKFYEEHLAAVDSMAAERFILGEMDQAERDAFEEHFFDCVECSRDVRDETKIAAAISIPGVLDLEPAVPRRNWWAVAAAVVIALGGAYLWPHRVPKPVGQPVSVAAAEQSIELDSSRGPSDVHKLRAGQPVALYFVIPPPEQPPLFYTCQLQDAAGVTVKTISVTRKQAQSTVTMPLNAQTLRSGKYNVVIRGGDREIAAYPFMVEVR